MRIRSIILPQFYVSADCMVGCQSRLRETQGPMYRDGLVSLGFQRIPVLSVLLVNLTTRFDVFPKLLYQVLNLGKGVNVSQASEKVNLKDLAVKVAGVVNQMSF